MSTIDFSNSKVLRNYSISQAREGKGKIYIKKEVVCFENDQGIEFVVPSEYEQEFRDKLSPVCKKEECEEKHSIDDLSVAQAKYLEVFGHNVPNNMKNNLEWINSKL